MKVTVIEKGSCAIAEVEGSLTNEFLGDFEKEIERLFRARRNIILDFTRLTFILSSGLGVLLAYHVNARKERLHFIICGLNSQVQRLFAITDLNKHLNIADNIDEALEMVENPVS